MFSAARGGGSGAGELIDPRIRTPPMLHVGPLYTYLQIHWGKLVWTDLRGEPVSDGVHVVAGCWGAHESVRVAWEAVTIGWETVSRAAVGTQTSLVHGGWRQGLGSVQCTALWHQEQHTWRRGKRESRTKHFSAVKLNKNPKISASESHTLRVLPGKKKTTTHNIYRKWSLVSVPLWQTCDC